MHEFVMKIGYAVLELFASINGKNLLDALEVMGIGMLGIFLVTGIIIGCVALLNKLCP